MADTTGFGGLDSNLVPDRGTTDYKSDRWKSTGRGDFPDIKIRPVSLTNAFMYLRDPSHGTQRDKTTSIRLWVHEITLGWSMSYQQAQTAFGKSFYPRHIQYANAVIKGQTASQEHYDDIVDMVLRYQSSSIVPGTKDFPNSSFDIVRFEMPAVGYHMAGGGKAGPWKKGDAGEDKTYYRYDRVYFDGFPLKITAGHRKGVFNPEFEISFMVMSYRGENTLASGSSIDSEKALMGTLNVNGFTKTEQTGSALSESGYNNFTAAPDDTSNQGAIDGGTGGNQG
jgi:hypothetical protein